MLYVRLLLAVAEGGHGAPSHGEHYIGPIEAVFRQFLPEAVFTDQLLGINIWHIILLFFPFIVTMIVMNYFLFRPMTRVLEERERRTVGFRKEAEEFEERFRSDLDRFETHMADARKQASEERARIRKETTDRQDEILGAARQEVAKTLDAIRAEIAKEREGAQADLEQRASELATEVAAKVLGRPVRVGSSQPQEGA